MGHTITVLACATGHKDALLSAAGLIETSDPDRDNAAAISGASNDTHFVIWLNLHQSKVFRRIDYKLISKAVPFYVLDVVESVDSAAMRRFEGGERIWWIDGGVTGYTAIGDPPFKKDDLIKHHQCKHADLSDQDAAKDGFGLVVAASEITTRFRYDDAPHLAFQRLEGSFPTRKTWWQLW